MENININCINEPTISIKSFIFDCDNPKKLAEFYSKLLGGEVSTDPYGGISLKIPNCDITLGFQYAEFYQKPVWLGRVGEQQPMAHLDLKVNNIEKAVNYALSIGASKPPEQFCQPDWGVYWVMLFDLAGHPICFFEE